MLNRSMKCEEFIGLMQTAFPDDDVFDLCRQLLRNGSTYGRLQQIRRVRDHSPFQQRQEARTERRIRELCGRFPDEVKPVFSRNPECPTVRICLTPRNPAERDGGCWAIPTS
jgi:hypothetical protein